MARLLIVPTVVTLFVVNLTSATFSHGGGYSSGDGYGGATYHGPLAAPVVLASGHLADTSEVAAAKNAHYSALLAAKADSGSGGGYSGGYGGGNGGGYGVNSGYGTGAGYGGSAYNGPLAAPVVLSSGHLADTKDVADAKNAHYTALLSAKATSGYGSGYASGDGSGYGSGSGYKNGAGYGSGASFGGGAYHGPLAAPVVLPSGHLADTEDVAAAKGAHYVALSEASSRSGFGGGYYGKH